MPTYEYKCDACGHKLEEFQSMTAKALKKCPDCGKSKLVRQIGIGAGIIFKGSGFYETDYRSEGYKKDAKAEKDSAKPKKQGKGESKTEAKGGDGKPADGGSGTKKSSGSEKSKPDKPAKNVKKKS